MALVILIKVEDFLHLLFLKILGNACSERREERGTENKKGKNSEINNGYKVFNNKRFMLDKIDHQSNVSKIFLYLTFF